ncbi:hypothetical protein [Roseomonas sp. WA12]
MRPTLQAMALSLALLPAAAQAQPQPQPQSRPQTQPTPRTVIGAPGRCEMTVNDQPRTCSSGLVYVHHTNGSVLISIASGPGVTIGFQGDSDRQPRPEDYTLNLTRLHTSVSGRTAAKDVTGQCEISMSADGKTWHRATCRATDRGGMVTVMTFTGDGRPVTAAHPGQEGAPANRQPTPATRDGAKPGAPATPPKG